MENLEFHAIQTKHEAKSASESILRRRICVRILPTLRLSDYLSIGLGTVRIILVIDRSTCLSNHVIGASNHIGGPAGACGPVDDCPALPAVVVKETSRITPAFATRFLGNDSVDGQAHQRLRPQFISHLAVLACTKTMHQHKSSRLPATPQSSAER